MPPIISFIGWHNSGKTTLASQVVSHLKSRDYSVAVIKSTKETNIIFDRPGTDTHTYSEAGADTVTLIAPDQMVMMTKNPDINLTSLAHRYFADMDIVVAEGFKQERHIAKIEVSRGDTELLRDQVTGVIAVATDRQISGDYIFRLDESFEIADFIEKRFLNEADRTTERTTLLVNGSKVPLKDFIQESLAGTVAGFVHSLKATHDMREIELRIHLTPDT
ncbi:MAG: molybdopterin-guanine dinucleotide biosynthesis protein B [Desulfobulbaceae bacterium]|nr:molybdopterin-guanine dinucleotide biosynthesis protein B [Desulfobulbaceae bacterium]